MTDLELLELAAKAAGLPPEGYEGGPGGSMSKGGLVWSGAGHCIDWNPLEDDGDALRLQVKLHMDIEAPENGRSVWAGNGWGNAMVGVENNDWLAATRRAIVGAAAEMAPTTVDQRTVDIPL